MVVKIDELISHKIKLVIYANQTLRASHAAMSTLLSKLVNAESIKEVNEMMSSMDEIFRLQSMYDIKTMEEIMRVGNKEYQERKSMRTHNSKRAS